MKACTFVFSPAVPEDNALCVSWVRTEADIQIHLEWSETWVGFEKTKDTLIRKQGAKKNKARGIVEKRPISWTSANDHSWEWKSYNCQLSVSPQTPTQCSRSDQFQISPAASPEMLHHTVWRTWLFIAYSDDRWLYYQFPLPHFCISLKRLG